MASFERLGRRQAILGLGLMTGSLFLSCEASAQDAQPPAISIPPISSLEDLVRLSPSQLDALYASGSAVALPEGQVRGRAIYFPGTSMAVPVSKAARLVWQGKVIDRSGTQAVNRFFGMKVVKAKIYQAESWRDGNPSLILDYQDTSRIYARNRDEIRQVAPGIYLGLMYARTSPTPTLKLYFVLDSRP